MSQLTPSSRAIVSGGFAAIDLTALQHTWVAPTANAHEYTTATAVDTDAGLLINDPSAGGSVAVQKSDIATSIASAAIAIGDSVAPTTGGKSVTVTAALANGIAKTAAAADGDFFEVIISLHTAPV